MGQEELLDYEAGPAHQTGNFGAIDASGLKLLGLPATCLAQVLAPAAMGQHGCG